MFSLMVTSQRAGYGFYGKLTRLKFTLFTLVQCYSYFSLIPVGLEASKLLVSSLVETSAVLKLDNYLPPPPLSLGNNLIIFVTSYFSYF